MNHEASLVKGALEKLLAEFGHNKPLEDDKALDDYIDNVIKMLVIDEKWHDRIYVHSEVFNEAFLNGYASKFNIFITDGNKVGVLIEALNNLTDTSQEKEIIKLLGLVCGVSSALLKAHKVFCHVKADTNVTKKDLEVIPTPDSIQLLSDLIKDLYLKYKDTQRLLKITG